jgi:hypothetical protein
LTIAAAAVAVSGAAIAMPPPVPVTAVVVAGDPATESSLRALVTDMSRRGHFDAALAEPPARNACADVGQVMRATCYATAARGAGNPHLVFVHAEPAGATFHLDCIGPDQDRAQRAELSLSIAAGTDEAAAREQRHALSGCLVGALHAPPVPRPPAGGTR